TIEEFRERAASDLEAHGVDPRRSRIEASVDLRFRGQSYEISVPARGDLARAFRREHRRRYGYASRSERIELVTIRLVARVPRAVPRPRPPQPASAVAPHSRRVLLTTAGTTPRFTSVDASEPTRRSKVPLSCRKTTRRRSSLPAVVFVSIDSASSSSRWA